MYVSTDGLGYTIVWPSPPAGTVLRKCRPSKLTATKYIARTPKPEIFIYSSVCRMVKKFDFAACRWNLVFELAHLKDAKPF